MKTNKNLSKLTSWFLIFALLLNIVPIIDVTLTVEANVGPGGALRPFGQTLNHGYAQTRVMPTNRTQTQMNQDVADQFNRLLSRFIVDPTHNTSGHKNTFRMALNHEAGTGQVGDDGVAVCEAQGFGMVMLAYMAGAEDMLVPSVPTNLNSPRVPLRQRLRDNLPASLRSSFGADEVTIKHYFDAMFRTVQAFPATNEPANQGRYLMSWQIRGREGPWTTQGVSMSSATDGALDTTYALLLADRQWGGVAHGKTNTNGGNAVASDSEYLYWAKGGMHQLWLGHVNHRSNFGTSHGMTVGNWTHHTGNTARIYRSSDAMLTHFRAFAEVGNTENWNRVIEATNTAINQVAHPTTGLLPDFMWYGTNNQWRPLGQSPSDGLNHWNEAGANDARYHWNACRTPWRIAMDVLHNGTTVPVNSTVQRINSSMNTRASGNFSSIRGGDLDGTFNSSSGGSAFQAPYLVTAAAYGPANWMTNGWDWARGRTGNPDNYGDYIHVLSMIAASGNWWCPITPVQDLCVSGHTPGAAATCGTPQTCTVCFYEIAPATGNHTRGAANCTICSVCTVTGLIMNCGSNPCPAHINGNVLYDMQLDAVALSDFTSVSGRAAHSLLTARNSPIPTIGSTPVSVTIPDSRGGSSQGLDIRIAPVGTVGTTDYGTGTLSGRAGHLNNQYPASNVYKFAVTVRITAGTDAGRQTPPYDVWVRPAIGGTGDNVGSTYLARNQTVQNDTDVNFEFELTGAELTSLISQGANVIRIGGASRNNLQVRSLIITEKVGGGTITAPTAPQNFTATPGNGQVTLSWTAPANSGGGTITGYQVSSNDGLSWVSATSNTSHTFTGLTNGTSYTFQVRAVNSAGNGAVISATATPFDGYIRVTVVKIEGIDVIEITNLTTDRVISTKGLFLSDDDEDLFKWQMPSFIMRAGESILIRSTDDSTTIVLKRATTNFDVALSERVSLTDARGNVLSEWNR